MRIQTHLKRLISVATVALLLGVMLPAAHAQTTSNVTLTLVEERMIGTDCPLASALSSSGSILWVLMYDCFYSDHYLLQFTIGGDGFDFDTNGGEDYASSLEGLEDTFIDGLRTSPLSVGEDGSPRLQVIDNSGQMQSINHGDGPSSDNSALSEQLANITPYPEFSIYNGDLSLVAANGTDGVYILDTQTGAEVLAIEVQGGTDYVFPQFSADGQSIDLIIPNNPDDPSATRSTLYRYSIPGGELQLELDLLSSLAWVSPNGQYVLLWMGEDELVVTEPATGGVSDMLHMFDEPRLMTDCANEDGFDPTDLQVVWDGFLPPMGIHWLPDSSGFVTVNSYMGTGAASDNATCAFSESRLRRYSVGHEG